jgi:hypothetical protein
MNRPVEGTAESTPGPNPGHTHMYLPRPRKLPYRSALTKDNVFPGKFDPID